MYYVYILRCADNRFYVVPSQNFVGRVKAHNEGRGATYTFKHLPVRVVYSEAFRSEDESLARERKLKRWTHAKKDALIAGDFEHLKHLSKRRS